MSVRSSLSVEGTILNMNQINNEYVSLLKEHDLTFGWHHKKYLKELIVKNIPDVEFVKSVCPNEAEQVTLASSVRQAVSHYSTQDQDDRILAALLDVSLALRREILEKVPWKFTGELGSYENPPMLQVFLKHLLFGQSTIVGERREAEEKKTLDVACQLLIQNTRIDRQVKLKTKSNRGFLQRTETPLSVGLPLAIHTRVRDKSLVTALSSVFLGTGYSSILNIEKRIEHGVLLRMQDTPGGITVCLPDWLKIGVSLTFAVDNIDMLEDTAYGQNTFHGTIVVMNQCKDENADPIQEPLIIPDKAPAKPLQMEVHYLSEPTITKKPIRFQKFTFGERQHHLKLYQRYTHTWVMASCMGDETDESPITPDGEISTAFEGDMCNTVAATDLTNDHGDDLHVPSDDESIAKPVDCSDNTGETVENSELSILSVKSRDYSKVTLAKKEVMPTWAATKSLLLNHQTATHLPCKMNSEVLAPLFKTPPTDFARLYTVLRLTQNISAVVVGPERRTIIELDLDLYQRAVQIQQSVKNKNWILKAGVLHICFAALHALGKTVEGSGMDTVAVDTGIYSAAALRGIYGGKAFKRGVEYHTMMSVAIMTMKFEAILSDLAPGPLRLQCRQLRKALHDNDPGMVEIYQDLESYYAGYIEGKESEATGELACFFNKYLEQVESVLQIIASCRQGDWPAYLAALDNQIKYFFAADLLNYARLMPLHLAEMNQLETDDPVTWAALKDGAFVVTKSDIPFTSIFTDQNLEQKIKDLKGHGGFVGLTQDEVALDRLIHTTPYLARIVKSFLSNFPSASTSSSGMHYQLSGDVSVRLKLNVVNTQNSMTLHCLGNPFITAAPLKNIVSSALIPETVKPDILQYTEKGQMAYEAFVSDRLVMSSTKSIWDPMKKLKLKNFTNWTQKTKVKFGDKVVKLREDRQFLGRCLIVQEARPEIVPKLEDMIGNYELSVVPRSLFAADGSLLLPYDKASIIHAVEAAKQHPLTDVAGQISSVIDSVEAEPRNLNLTPEQHDHVLIIDAMAVLHSMKKTPGMTTICHLKMAFNARIERMLNGYVESRIIFDRYIEGSLKEKTRSKRAMPNTVGSAGHDVHDSMSISTISMKQLLSCTSTKHSLSCHLAHGLLEHFEGKAVKVVVVYDTVAKSINPRRPTEEHSHEEADTLIPLHVLLSIQECTFREVHVWSPDSDVLVLLIDLVSHNHLGAMTQLKFLTGKGAKYREIDVLERVQALGRMKSRALLGFHHFTGADWGGRFVGVSKKTWMNAFLSLEENDSIIDSFGHLGEEPLPTPNVDGDKTLPVMPAKFQSLETFVCMVYAPKHSTQTLPKARWELFRAKNLESEMLPPTRGTLIPHIQRANFLAMRDKGYTSLHPWLPNLEDNGWSENGLPVTCLVPPAPCSVVEMVKCGCKKDCTRNCSCMRNSLVCTPLYKCYTGGCFNHRDYRADTDEEEEADSDWVLS